MPFVSTRAKLVVSEPDAIWLRHLAQSRTAAAAKVQRAQILLRYSQGETVSAIATVLRTNRPKIERCLSKALQLGVRAALEDLPGRGRPARISDEAKAWVVNLACQKPKELGYAQELWTTRLLAKHIRHHCRAAGHEPLAKLGRGTVSKILAAHPVRPHKLGNTIWNVGIRSLRARGLTFCMFTGRWRCGVGRGFRRKWWGC